jgi:hypothetical protein
VTATVVADEFCTVSSLSAADLRKMEGQDSELAAVFHRFIARLLGERFARQTKTLQALMC